MLAVYTEPVRTPISFEEAAIAMRAALRAHLLEEVRDDVLALALAKTTLECGRDKARGLLYSSSWNHCIGNIKAGSKFVGMYTCYPCNEVEIRDGKKKTIWYAPEGELTHKGGPVRSDRAYAVPPGHPQTRFRAYANRYDAAYEYVGFLADAPRYAQCWKELKEGDPIDFVAALKRAGYFTADEGPYRAAVLSLFTEYRGKLKGLPVDEAPEVDIEDLLRRCMLRDFWSHFADLRGNDAEPAAV